MLQGEVAWQINQSWLARIPFLNATIHENGREKGQHPDMQLLRVKVALALRPNVYAPNETVCDPGRSMK